MCFVHLLWAACLQCSLTASDDDFSIYKYEAWCYSHITCALLACVWQWKKLIILHFSWPKWLGAKPMHVGDGKLFSSKYLLCIFISTSCNLIWYFVRFKVYFWTFLKKKSKYLFPILNLYLMFFVYHTFTLHIYYFHYSYILCWTPLYQ